METRITHLTYHSGEGFATVGLKVVSGVVSLKIEVLLSERDYKRLLAARRIVKDKAAEYSTTVENQEGEHIGQLSCPVTIVSRPDSCGDDHEET